jgi:hypothetical protein
MARRNEKSDMQKRREDARNKSKQRAEDREVSSGGSTLALPDGTENFEHSKKCSVDIVPFIVGSGPNKGSIEYVVDLHVHMGVGPDERWRLCPNKMLGLPCPICDARKKMTKDGAPDEDIKALRPKKRQVFNVIDTEDRKKGVQVWEISYFNFGEQLLEDIDHGVVPEGFFLDVDGNTLNLRFKMASMGTNKYLKISRIDAEERKDYGEKIYKETVDLVSALKILSYEDLEAEFLGIEAPTGQSTDDEEAEAEAPELVQSEEPYGEEPEPEEEPEVEEEPAEEPTPKKEKPAAATRRPRRSDKKKEEPEVVGGKCPEGFEFGTDYDKDQEKCDACAIWSECHEAYEESK